MSEGFDAENALVPGDGVRIAFIRGSLTYLKPPEIVLHDETNWSLQYDEERITTPDGTYMMMIAPYDVDGVAGNEGATRSAISRNLGLLTAYFGPNVTYEFIYECRFGAETGHIQVTSPVVTNPNAAPPVNLAPERLARFEKLSEAIARLPETAAQRVRLALRWYQKAEGRTGVDNFLALWIAIETLSMPDSTDIGPLIGTIAKAYSLSRDEVGRQFLIGRLYGLRGRILHHGETPPLDFRLISYVAAIFRDLLFEQLGLPCERAAETHITTYRTAVLEVLAPGHP